MIIGLKDDMSIKISKSKYKDVNSITIENKHLKASFLPGIGAKLCSLIHKESDREFLYQRLGSEYKLQSYGGDYLKGECSGFDDMFPTIDEYFFLSCYYASCFWF